MRFESVSVFFALLTSFTNGAAVTLQHIASTSDATKSKGFRFVLYLLRHPLWLLGWVALFASLVCQALALHFGPLSVVQPILVTELIIALVLRQVWLRQSIRALTWFSALVTAAGLVTFLVAASPSASLFAPSTSSWTWPTLTCGAVAALLVALAQRGSRARRAGLLGSATAVIWALEATFIKATSDTISALGVSGALSRWPVYALIVAGVAGLLCEQAALHVGPLSISQPLIVIVDPVVSVALGVWIYREHLRADVGHLSVGLFAFAVMCGGVIALTKTSPTSMTPDTHRR